MLDQLRIPIFIYFKDRQTCTALWRRACTVYSFLDVLNCLDNILYLVYDVLEVILCKIPLWSKATLMELSTGCEQHENYE